MHKFALWVKELTSTTGTGDILLGGAPGGYATFASQLTNGDTTVYTITDGQNRELGIGTFQGATLQRTTVLATLIAGVFAKNPAVGLNLSGNADISVTESDFLLTWADSIRESTGHGGEVLVVDPTTGLAGLSDVVDGGVIP